MQEEAQRTHRRETLCSYHAPSGVRVSPSLSLSLPLSIYNNIYNLKFSKKKTKKQYIKLFTFKRLNIIVKKTQLLDGGKYIFN